MQVARNLEKSGKINTALKFYAKVAREAPDTEEGREAAARIAELRRRRELLGGLYSPYSPMVDAQ
jgi:hypothetical protein